MTIPKADLHVHSEGTRRLDQYLARRDGRPPYDWTTWRRELVAAVPPGFQRFQRVGSVNPVPLADDDDDCFIGRYVEVLAEAAAAGAWYVEVRTNASAYRDGFMELFREAERQVQRDHPRLRAEAIAIVMMMTPLNGVAERCLTARAEGLAGIDFLYQPYDTEADWTPIHRLAEEFAAAGLGITAHAGEASTANIAAAVRTPGLTRIGHGLHAVRDPTLVELLIERGVTLECCLTSSTFFGVLPDHDPHPLPALLDAGVSMTLATDDPLQLGTTIEGEYAAAAALGLSESQLITLTGNAFRASFTSAERRERLLLDLDNC